MSYHNLNPKDIRHHVTRRRKVSKALKHLRTIAVILLRELKCWFPEDVLEGEAERFALYERVLAQKPKDNNKVYSLISWTVTTLVRGRIISRMSIKHQLWRQKTAGDCAVASCDQHMHDSMTLEVALASAYEHCDKNIKPAMVDRGYRGVGRNIFRTKSRHS